MAIAPVFYGLATKGTCRIEPQTSRVAEVTGPILPASSGGTAGRSELGGVPQKLSGRSVARAFINDKHEIDAFLGVWVDPVPNVSTNGGELRGKRLKGGKITGLGPTLLLANGTLEILSKLQSSFIGPSSFQGLDHVFGWTMARGTVEKVQLLS